MRHRRKKRFDEPKGGGNLKIVETFADGADTLKIVETFAAVGPTTSNTMAPEAAPQVVVIDAISSPIAASIGIAKTESIGAQPQTVANSPASTTDPETEQKSLDIPALLSAISSVGLVLGALSNLNVNFDVPWQRPSSRAWSSESAAQRWSNLKTVTVGELKNHRVPLVVLACILLSPKLLWLWGSSIFLKRPATLLWHKLPAALQERGKRLIPSQVHEADWLDELNEGMEQSRPFAIGACFLFCVPFALVWMFVAWCERLFWPRKDKGFIREPERIDFTQNRDRSQDEIEDNFIHSPAFTITALLMTALGIPVAVSFILYQGLGIDRLLGLPVDHLFISRVVCYLYMCGWGCAFATLFMRAWFTFPLNFLSDEHRIEMTPKGIRRHSHRGWFLYVITLNRPSAGVDSLKWKDVESIRMQEDGGARLYPLPDVVFPRTSLIYKAMNKAAAVIDGFSQKIGTRKQVLISAGETACSRSVPINLADLNAEQRVLLFHQIRQWAPSAVIDRKAQEQLVGSVVLQGDVRYTQIWFDVLSTRNKTSRTSQLESGEQLQQGQWTVIDRLGSGGQATAYLARRRDGTTCVLKEFILSQAESSGALLESAREFEAEASLLSQLKHDRIVQLIDVFSEDGRVYVVLEHIEGQTLRQLVKEKGPLDQAQVVRIAVEVCDILCYLHGLTPAMVHRDLTPENIIVQADGSIKLIDFSLAIRHKEKTMTASVGKNSFTPPEQFRDQSCPQSDIYALGATMYYALTGAIPKPLTKSSPRECDSTISEALNAVVERATELDLAKRYECADWLRLELAGARY